MVLSPVPNPVPLRRPLPAALQPPPARAPENHAEREARQLAFLRELAELNMLAAREAADRIRHRIEAAGAAEPNPETPATPAAAEPTLALVRATRAVAAVINLERRVAAGEVAAPATADDPRGLILRKFLHPLANAEPDPVRRRTLRARVNDRIDDALGADLDDDLSLADIAGAIAAENGLPFNIAKVPDCFLFPISDPACTDPAASISPRVTEGRTAGPPPAGTFGTAHPLPRGQPAAR